MRRKYLLVSACCTVAVLLAGCSGRPPDAATTLKAYLSASHTSTISLQFTTADGYLGTIQDTSKKQMTDNSSASTDVLSVSGANQGFLQCTLFSDTASGQTTVEAPNSLKEALASDGSLDDASALSFRGTDNLGIDGTADNLTAWIKKNQSDARFTKGSNDPFSTDGTLTWTLTAEQTEAILKPVLDAMGKPLGKAIVQSVDSGFAVAYFDGLEAGGKQYTLDLSITDGKVNEITLQSKGFVSASSLQAQADPYTGKVDTGKIDDGLSLTVKVQSGVTSMESAPQSAVAVG